MSYAPTPTQQLTVEVLAWPGTTVRIGERTEFAFDAHGHELGHLHGDRVAHFFFNRVLGAELHEAGRVSPHPVAPKSVKMGARPIESEADVADILTMMRLNYEHWEARAAEKAAGAAGPGAARAGAAAEAT